MRRSVAKPSRRTLLSDPVSRMIYVITRTVFAVAFAAYLAVGIYCLVELMQL